MLGPGQATRDVQAHSGSGHVVRLAAHERLEYVVAGLVADAGPAVGDLQHEATVVDPTAQLDVLALRPVLFGVGQQIQEDLRDGIGITLNGVGPLPSFPARAEPL